MLNITHTACRQAASSLTASVVCSWAPMPHSPFVISEIFTQVTLRMFSPSIETMASVNFWMICRLCSDGPQSKASLSCSSVLASPARGH